MATRPARTRTSRWPPGAVAALMPRPAPGPKGSAPGRRWPPDHTDPGVARPSKGALLVATERRLSNRIGRAVQVQPSGHPSTAATARNGGRNDSVSVGSCPVGGMSEEDPAHVRDRQRRTGRAAARPAGRSRIRAPDLGTARFAQGPDRQYGEQPERQPPGRHGCSTDWETPQRNRRSPFRRAGRSPICTHRQRRGVRGPLAQSHRQRQYRVSPSSDKATAVGRFRRAVAGRPPSDCSRFHPVWPPAPPRSLTTLVQRYRRSSTGAAQEQAAHHRQIGAASRRRQSVRGRHRRGCATAHRVDSRDLAHPRAVVDAGNPPVTATGSQLGQSGDQGRGRGGVADPHVAHDDQIASGLSAFPRPGCHPVRGRRAVRAALIASSWSIDPLARRMRRSGSSAAPGRPA